MSIKVKALLSPLVIIVCFIIVGVYTIKGLSEIDHNVRNITQDLAPDAGIASHLMGDLYRKRLQVKDYIKTSSESSIEKFQQAESDFRLHMEEAQRDIASSEGVALIENIDQLNNAYNDAFFNVVVKNMQEGNRLVNEVINVKGPLVESNLSKIVQAAFDDTNKNAVFYATNVQKHLLLGQLSVFKFLTDNDEASKARAEEELQLASSNLRTLVVVIQMPERKQLAKSITADLDEYRKAFSMLEQVILARNEAIDTILSKTGSLIASDSLSLSNNVFTLLKAQGEVVEKNIAFTTRFISVLTVSAIAVGLLIAIFVMKGILYPIKKTNLMIKDIAEGNGDLTKRINVVSKDEIGELGGNFNVFVDKLQQLIIQLSGAAGSIASSADGLSSITEQTKANANNQKSETEQVATAMSQMNSSVQDVAKNAEEASVSGQLADQQANEGCEIVTKAIVAVETLTQEIDGSSATIDKLRADSENIGAVLDVIKSIAEQTNLLALNAAIEAARAGEQGRGFAVVADEVRSLAKRTQESTLEIDALIESLREVAEQTIGVMDKSRERAKNVMEHTNSAGAALNKITEAVTNISFMNTQIATAAHEQSYVSEEINRRIANISEISEKTSSDADQTHLSSVGLADLSEQLNGLICQFKT